MTFKLGARSEERLLGVDERLVDIVQRAISLTKQDFSVICGRRTKQEQEALVAKGASQTMKSKHLEGKAVDLMAYVAGSCLLYTSPSPRDATLSRMPSSA